MKIYKALKVLRQVDAIYRYISKITECLTDIAKSLKIGVTEISDISKRLDAVADSIVPRNIERQDNASGLRAGYNHIVIDFWSNFTITVLGGPYRDRPVEVPGIKLAKEINAPCDVDLKIKDFGVPTVEAVEAALIKTVLLAKAHGIVYVGCMGGIGRTGMFIALFQKLADTHFFLRESKGVAPSKEENMNIGEYAICKVREQYLSHAIETQEQESLIRNIDFVKTVQFLQTSKIFSCTLPSTNR